jgi:hypothetical protein
MIKNFWTTSDLEYNLKVGMYFLNSELKENDEDFVMTLVINHQVLYL